MKASYCQYREKKNAETFAAALTSYGIPTQVERINISPCASTAPEDRWAPDDYRFSVVFEKSLEPAFLRMRAEAKAAGVPSLTYVLSKIEVTA